MANIIENLGKLKRRMTISLPNEIIQKEIETRIRKIASNVRMPGFRPGKVPLKIIMKQYARQVTEEALTDKIGKEFFTIIRAESLCIVGQPTFTAKQEVDRSEVYTFDATFEVYPEVKLGDISSAEIGRQRAQISDAEIDYAIEILRKQAVHFRSHDKAGTVDSAIGAQNGNRVTIDFVGKINGEGFFGGSAENFTFVLGEGKLLPEFEQTVLGLSVGESRECDVKFPSNYYSKEIAGKIARFTITANKIEWPNLPTIDAELAKFQDIEDASPAEIRTKIKESLEREAERLTKFILKNQVMDALLQLTTLDVPHVLIEQELQRLVQIARQDLAKHSISVAARGPLPDEILREWAERRVKLGLILVELVKKYQLEAKPEQILAQVNKFSKSYEHPKEVVRWYYSDKNRLGDVEAHVVESNVVDFVLGKAKVTDEEVSFEKLVNARSAV
ncbi:trigger factor [Candidatus Vallotia cooleyia]|uniref:trigger factor n=1 Tax=Candidatus Vallotiella adelgis TaxID=1177211 RepID=UPI001D01490F|nr:trigger factor [Candidatus Vallotia cooleyia]UDG82284.1 Trigger factor [Candidatus Vallotia cooleyia]